MSNKCDIGVLGLAVMGANLARNAARKGYGVALYNRTPERTRALVEEFGHEGRFIASETLEAFVASLAKPRAIVIMVKAGDPVDRVIEELLPYLEEGDIVIDGGNSLYTDTNRRFDYLEGKNIRFIGMGVSGGEEGALEGPSMMPGGNREAYERIEPIVTKMAAQVKGESCCTYIGRGGAGHYVKMVHNGIEYADMQLIAEVYDIFRTAYGLSAAQIGDIFDQWKTSDLGSYLIEITSDVLHKTDDTGAALVDNIVDQAEQKGTGRWTAINALELGVPLTGITEAVFARVLSSKRALRIEAETHFPSPSAETLTLDPSVIEKMGQALLAAKIIAYAQGFEQMEAASEQYGWELHLGEVARIWRGGCIIRAGFLDRITEAYAGSKSVQNLALQPYFGDAIRRGEAAWREVVALAITHGVAVPAFASSLSYFDGLRRSRGPANLIQGLRDYFGAHTYRRLDKDGAFHTRWGQDGSEVSMN